MKEQKIVKVDTDYSANNEIEKLRKDGWLVGNTNHSSKIRIYDSALYVI